MSLRNLLTSTFSRFAQVSGLLVLACSVSTFHAQSLSGFTYNGLNLTSYSSNEYNNSAEAAQTMRATGANYGALLVTQYMQTSTSNVIAPETTSSAGYNSSLDPTTPSDAALVTAIQNMQAQGLVVSMKPQVDSLDGVFRGSFAPTSPAAWFQSYQTFILHYAQIAAQNHVGMLVIGTELKSLTTSTYKSNWETIISALRAQYPGLTLAYGANATGAGDEFTSVSFWADVDVIGVDGYFPLTNQKDPSLAALVAAWTDNASGFKIVAALQNLQSTYNKPLIFTEIGYVSVAGTNEQPYASISGNYDATEQENCYEAFFEVFSQQTAWMKGVFWWDWSVSPPAANDTGYSSQNKPAGTVTLPKWFNNTASGFSIAPASSTMAVGQGLTGTNVISISDQGGFAGAVTLAATGLPAGVTASFAAGVTAGTQTLTLTASSTAALAGPVTVTVTGTSGGQTATTAIAFSLVAPATQTITFTNPGAQTVGATVALSATSNSYLAITYASTTPTVCSTNSAAATVTLLTTGTCTISASQAAGATYTASSTSQSFPVTALSTVPIPANANVILSQINYLANVGGYALSAGNPAGGSLGVNTVGMAVIANNVSVEAVNTTTGVLTTLGAWGNAAAVAIDPANNAYVGNSYGPLNVIVEIPYVGGTANAGYAAFTTPTASTPVCVAGGKTECVLPANLGSVNASTMTFDAAGNLFYATAGTAGPTGVTGNSIFECNAACVAGTGAPVLVYTEPTVTPAPSATSGQPQVGSVAVDSVGNLFFSESTIYVNSSYAYYSFTSSVKELAISTGAGFGGVVTGFSATPIALYTLNTPNPASYGNQVDGVVVQRSSGGDTIYFADENDGVFGFPDTRAGISVVNGKPTALFTAGNQGGKNLAVDAAGNLYPVGYSSATGSGGDTLAQITQNAVLVPTSPTGTAVSPSTTTSPITTILNDTTCAGPPSPAVTFATHASASATVTATASSTCSSTFTGAAGFATTITFTPLTAGADTATVTATDQSGNSSTASVSGMAVGFTLTPSATALTLAQSASATDTITVSDFAGFTGSVTLTATGLPTGVTAAFGTNPTSGASVLTLTATSTATVGGPVNVTITGTSGTTRASTTIALTVIAPPTFAVMPAAASVSVTQGSSSTDAITITSTGQVPGSVTFAATGLPAGVTASFSPNPSTNGATTLTLTAAANATVSGPVNITVTGTSGGTSQSATIAVTVAAAPGFTLASTPAAVTVAQAASTTATVNITYAGGFTGAVTLAATGLPTGVTAAFATNPATASSVLTLTATATATTGIYSVTVTGTSGTLTSSFSLPVTVSLPPTFTLASSSASTSVAQSGSATNTVTVTGANGFNGSVQLVATGLPSGVTAAFATNPATGSSVVTFTALTSAATGTATVTITGTSGTLTASTTIALTVTAGPSFTLTPAAASLTLVQGKTASDAFTITANNGFSGPVMLTVGGLPSGVTGTFTTNPATSATTLTLTASAAATTGGPVTVTVSGTSGTVTGSATVALTVNVPPSFTLVAAPATLVIPQTTSVTSTVTVVAVGGFSSAPTLTASGLPTGVTASFAPGTVAGTQIVTFTASAAAVVSMPSPTAVTITITGTSGALSAATTVSLTVEAAPSFTITGPALVVKAGAGVYNTTPLTITSTDGFAGAVALTCAITPAAASNPATCSIAPGSITLSASAPQMAVLTVNTTGGALAENHGRPGLWSFGSGTVLAFLLFLRLPRRRRLMTGLLLALFAAATLGISGCGSSPNYNTQSNGTSVGTYAVTITGTSGSTVATGSVSLTVQ